MRPIVFYTSKLKPFGLPHNPSTCSESPDEPQLLSKCGIGRGTKMVPSLFLFASITTSNGRAAAMDRMAIVRRHCPSLFSINTSEVAVLGNGAFALSVDVTGLQTLNDTWSGSTGTTDYCRCSPHADVQFPLMTSSDWAWHSSMPPGARGTKADPFAAPQEGLSHFYGKCINFL